MFKHLESIARKHAGESKPAWLLDDDGSIEVISLEELTKKDQKERIYGRTILLPPSVGGLRGGLLNGESGPTEGEKYDVSNEWLDENGNKRRDRCWDDEDDPPRMRLIRSKIDTKPNADEMEDTGEVESKRFWRWFVKPRSADDDGSRTSINAVSCDIHTSDVRDNAERIVRGLPLPDELRKNIVLAAKWHDLGKRRIVWQRSIGNPNPKVCLAKPGKRLEPVDFGTDYRHEFGSLLDVAKDPEFQQLHNDHKDLVLHLIAAHHGRGRPHFEADEAFDPSHPKANADAIASEVPRRFARLQRKYGRWGLAYLESLLRAADYAASANPSPETMENES